MDHFDRKILGLLGEDAKRSLADIGLAVGLSASAVNERIRRLTASGAIRRFVVDVDPASIGLGVLAFICLQLRQDADELAFRAYAASHSSVAECHHVTGPWSYLIKIHVASLTEVESFLSELKSSGFMDRSETILALSSASSSLFKPPPMVP